jgi:hypothetical protein
MEKIITVVGLLSIIVLFSFLLSWPVMILWNSCLVGAINGVNQIEWMQAWGINLLAGIIFKSGVSTK